MDGGECGVFFCVVDGEGDGDVDGFVCCVDCDVFGDGVVVDCSGVEDV